MRLVGCLILVCLTLAEAGCRKRSFDGPTVDAFTGRLTHNGNPVSFPEGAGTQLKLVHHGSAQKFDIPIQTDGTFKIGWMPIGKYSASMERPNADGKGKSVYTVPGGLTIEDGKTEYSIELGKDWRP
jgi:hypothetical protein